MDSAAGALLAAAGWSELAVAIDSATGTDPFLLRLSDTFRANFTEEAIGLTCVRSLAAHMRVDRCLIARLSGEEGIAHVGPEYYAEGLAPIGGSHRYQDFPEFMQRLQTGPLVVADVQNETGATLVDKASTAALGITALIAVHLHRGEGNGIWALAVGTARPRHWTLDELHLLQEAAERTWAAIERARAEAALRESERRYRNLFETMGQGYALVELIRDADGQAVDHRLLRVNPAFERLIGIPASGAEGRTGRELVPNLEDAITATYERVVRTGQPQHYEQEVAVLHRWYTVWVYPAGDERVTVLYEEITERKRAEALLREREEIKEFLLKLTDAFALTSDAEKIMQTASRQVGEHLRTDRAMYGEIHGEMGSRIGFVRAQHVRRGTPLPDRVDYEAKAQGAVSEQLRRGEAVVIADIARDSRLDEKARAAFLAAGTRALLVVSLIRNGREVVNFGVQHGEPREWTHTEVQLVSEVAERTWAAAERARAEARLRESEERQALVLKFSDSLRLLADSTRIQEEAARLLGERLDAGCVFYGEYDAGCVNLTVRAAYRRGDDLNLVGSHPIASPAVLEELMAGRTAIIEDVLTSPLFIETSRQRWLSRGFRSVVAVPIVRDGRLIASLTVADSWPREWTRDISLIEELAERIWSATERARVESALRESEERFRQFSEASSDALWIRDAATLNMEYVSPALEKIYGAEAGAFLGDIKKWAASIIPEDREHALAHIERARRGEAVVHEFRIQRPSDRAFRWIRNTDFPLRDEQGHVHRIGGIAEDITETKLAVEHQAILLAELQHRVRNIMAMIRSIAARTGEGAASVKEYAEAIAGRLLTLARVQALLTRAANAGVSIATILEEELGAQAQHGSEFTLSGPEIVLAPKAAEVLTLAVHELTTNALKYGALSTAKGRVSVSWTTIEKRGVPWLSFDWNEYGAQIDHVLLATSRRRGFGRELIEARIPYELGGQGQVKITSDGAQCHLEIPLKEGASIL
ncbi:MAG TPA: GAF domain-containing protein, partial [Steroidobacteraceae bacterium]|nr:GAF domain-containing protein [Steroidobacteraceae bacterium]